MADALLEATDVEKQFESVRAVDGLSFHVAPGEIFALLGPNGAGKTTMVRMLMGILRPDSGAITFRLAGTAAPPSSRELGYLPEDRGLYRDIPVERTLTYFGRLRGMSRAAARAAGLAWLERLGLGDRAKDKLDTLSKGNQQKVQFISSILHRPRFAVLDEPFSGLDPLNQNLFLDLLRDLRRDGMTILLSAHQMPLVERLADRVLLMNRGKQVLQGTLPELRHAVQAGTRLRFQVRGEVEAGAAAGLPGLAGVRVVSSNAFEGQVEESRPLNEVLQGVAARFEILGVHSEQLTLHDIYVRALGGDPLPEPANGEAAA